MIQDYAWSKEDAQRLKSIFAGAADAHMQRQAIVHLVEIICGVNQIGFDPDNSQITAFNAGRRWVARQIQNAITIPLDKLVEEKNDGSNRSVKPITATERAVRAAVSATGPAAGRKQRR